MDNKPTGKCYLLIAFLEALIRYADLLKVLLLIFSLKLFERVTAIFLLPGHSVNAQDVNNEPTTIAFYSSANQSYIVTPDAACSTINGTTLPCTFLAVVCDFYFLLIFRSE